MTQSEMTDQDLEDLELGREVRLHNGSLIALAHFCCLCLIKQAVQLNAGLSEYTEAGVTVNGRPEGDWKITVEDVSRQGLSKEGEHSNE